MTRFNQILSVVLVMQVFIAASIYISGQGSSSELQHTVLVNTETNQIDRITIEQNDGTQTILSKENETWQLPEYYQLPTDQSKVNNLLVKLTTTNSGWPAATTESSRIRFEVADNKFQKRITLSQGERALQTLYLGTSPGFRQLHVRRSGEDEVYAVQLNSFDFPLESHQWLDKTVLQPKAEIVGLRATDFAFDKKEGAWQLAKGNGIANKEEINKLADTLSRLTVQSADEKSAKDSSYELTVKAAGDTLQYRFFKEDDNYYVSRNDYPQVFKINKSEYENITNLTLTQLVKKEDEDPAEEKNSTTETITTLDETE